MIRIIITYISAITITTAAVYYAAALEHSGFKEKMIQYLDKKDGAVGPVDKDPDASVFLPSDKNNNNYYEKGEWSEYITDPEYKEHQARLKEGNIYSDETVNINSSGSVKINLNYGKSYYTDSKYKQYAEDKPKSQVINSGFWPEQTMLLHMDGTIGDRITVFIDHDSRREENHYLMNYRALSDEEVIREINAGEIDIKFNHSKYAVYDNTDAKGLGVDFTVGKGDFSLKTFGSISRGEVAVEYFKGNSSPSSTKISDYQYIRGTYYQLEPFLRYDSVNALPSGVSAYNLITFTSNPTDPSTYIPAQVNISPSGFELYIDDQNQYNNNNAFVLSLDGGYYTKMVSGTDYTINFTTGVIHFFKRFSRKFKGFCSL